MNLPDAGLSDQANKTITHELPDFNHSDNENCFVTPTNQIIDRDIHVLPQIISSDYHPRNFLITADQTTSHGFSDFPSEITDHAPP